MANILVVDSDDRKRADLKAKLTFNDVFVTEVVRGMEAIEELARSPFDLLVIGDLYGDSMDSIGLSSDVRRFFRGMRKPLIPIVLVTSERVLSGAHSHFNVVVSAPLKSADVDTILRKANTKS